jgi:hypothetical protein
MQPHVGEAPGGVVAVFPVVDRAAETVRRSREVVQVLLPVIRHR